jgi:protein-S-isoprenylcysteine O-methyltransferase Ste14
MSPTTLQIVAVTLGWMIFALTVVPIALRGRGRSARRDARSLAAMILQAVGFAMAWGRARAAAGAPTSAGAAAWTWAVVAGALAVASGAFAVAAVLRLGRQWSFVARVTEEHALISTGPYAIVRHPIYSAMLGLLIATGMTFSTVPYTIAGVICYLTGTLLRTGIEERLLIGAFGERYVDYKKRVPALFPLPRRHR